MKGKPLYITIFLVVLFAVVIMVQPINAQTTSESQPSIGQITFIRGMVYLEKAGDEKRLTYLNQPIVSQDVVSTGRDSYSVVTLSNGTRLNMNPNTILQVNSSRITAAGTNNQLTLNVIQGTVRVNTSPQASEEGFNVNSLSTVCGVRGTDFFVAVADNGSSSIQLIEGEVEIKEATNENADPITVERGQKLQVGLNQSVEVVEASLTLRENQITGDETEEEMTFLSSEEIENWQSEENQQVQNNPHSVIEQFTNQMGNLNSSLTQIQSTLQQLTNQANNYRNNPEDRVQEGYYDGFKSHDLWINVHYGNSLALNHLASKIVENNQNDETIIEQAETISRSYRQIKDNETQMLESISRLNESVRLLTWDLKLVTAFKSLNTRGIREAIENGANVNVNAPDGSTALMYVSYYSLPNMVSYLLSKEANVNLKNDAGATALLFAVSQGHYEIAQMLLEKGANTEVIAQTGYSPLMRAAQNNRIEMVELLIEYNANVNLQNNKGNTALWYAVEKGHTDIITLLSNNGANLNIKNQAGNTPLLLAVSNNQIEVVSHLLDLGADINITGENGHTALIYAVSKNYPVIMEILIERGANLEAVDNITGGTALIHAAAKGHFNMVQSLVEQGANINASDVNGNTALTFAQYSEREDMINYLLEHGAVESIE